MLMSYTYQMSADGTFEYSTTREEITGGDTTVV